MTVAQTETFWSHNWKQINYDHNYGWAINSRPFDHDRLVMFTDIVKFGRLDVGALMKSGYFDTATNTTYIRRQIVKQTTSQLGYSFVIQKEGLFVLLKGDKSKRAHEAKDVRFAYAIDLATRKPHVVATMKLEPGQETIKQDEIQAIAARQYAANSKQLTDDVSSVKPELKSSFIAPSKNGKCNKLYMFFERTVAWDKVLINSVK